MMDCINCEHNYKPPCCEPKCNKMCDGGDCFKQRSTPYKCCVDCGEEDCEVKRIWT